MPRAPSAAGASSGSLMKTSRCGMRACRTTLVSSTTVIDTDGARDVRGWRPRRAWDRVSQRAGQLPHPQPSRRKAVSLPIRGAACGRHPVLPGCIGRCVRAAAGAVARDRSWRDRSRMARCHTARWRQGKGACERARRGGAIYPAAAGQAPRLPLATFSANLRRTFP